MQKDANNTKAYLVGAGIASLAAAAYLIRDGKIPGKNIQIFEILGDTGGSLDGHGSPENGYIIRGGRMFDDDAFTCTYDLLSFIPSLKDPQKTVRAEMIEFNQKIKSYSHSRLVEKGIKDSAPKLGFSWKDRFELTRLLARSENSLGASSIQDNFSPGFFKTNFWFMWATTFAFQPWHSAVEFKRYMHRFIQQFPQITTLAGIRRTPLNQYDSIVLPVMNWLKAQGVVFSMNTQVYDLGIKKVGEEKVVEKILFSREGMRSEINIGSEDLVFVTNGSMTEDSSLGTMTTAPKLIAEKLGGSWKL